MEKINLRPLQGDDILKISAIAAKLDLKINATANATELGTSIIKQLLEKAHTIKDELNELLADLTGLSAEEVGKLPLKDYANLLKQLKDIKDLIGFFK